MSSKAAYPTLVCAAWGAGRAVVVSAAFGKN